MPVFITFYKVEIVWIELLKIKNKYKRNLYNNSRNEEKKYILP